MRFRILIIIFVVVLLGGLFFFLRPHSVSAPQTATNEPKRFEVTLQGGKNLNGPGAVQVMEGDAVILHITSDEAGEIHLHGYDVKLELEKNVPADLQFVADASGRFEYELESSGELLGTIIVEPR